MKSPFGEILRNAVQKTPGAVGGAFAAGDGELVDAFSSWDEGDWAILTAHYGILVNQMRSALHTFHFGDVEFMYMSFDKLDVLIQIIGRDYYALMALQRPASFNTACASLQEAVHHLSEEML